MVIEIGTWIIKIGISNDIFNKIINLINQKKI